MTAKRKVQPLRSGGSHTPRPRRQFTQEFKLEAVRLAAVGDRAVSEVARDLGIRAEMLRQ
jgi:transposase-like protein